MMTQASSPCGQIEVAVVSRWLTVCLSMILVSCSISGVSSKTQPRKSESGPIPNGSAVVVIPNPYVDDATLANSAADQTRVELIQRGYNVVSTEDQAQFVVIPTVETSLVSETPQTVTPVRVLAVAADPQMNGSGMLVNTFDSLPSFSRPKTGGSVKPGDKMLVIEAFNKDAWDKALIVNELQLPPVWKLRIPLPKELAPAVEGEAFARTGDTEFALPH